MKSSSGQEYLQALPREKAVLVLADGLLFSGVSVGASGKASGEVVFNTSMSGYQEILTDPSYAFQLLTFTYPHIGNVGVNSEDVESSKVQVAGMICREFSEHYSNYRAQKSLADYLREFGIVAISGIDTRSLVLHLRENGSQMGIIASGDVNVAKLIEEARSLPSMAGLDLVTSVSCKEAYEWAQGSWEPGSGYREYSSSELLKRQHVVAIDFGVKYNILRRLVDVGFRVTVVPAKTSSSEILGLAPDGVFLSNGPGDPAAVDYGVKTVEELLGRVPMFGICLGHQILGRALGMETFKLKFGHRGGNHPVRNESSGAAEITVQNHGFAVDAENIPESVEITHINLNDKTVEGLDLKDLGVFSVQYHPESSPGPRDASYLFEQFRDVIDCWKGDNTSAAASVG